MRGSAQNLDFIFQGGFDYYSQFNKLYAPAELQPEKASGEPVTSVDGETRALNTTAYFSFAHSFATEGMIFNSSAGFQLENQRVDNVVVEVDSAEIPVMDGSSEVFVDAIDQVGLVSQNRPRRYLRVLKEVRFDMGASWGVFSPHHTTRYEVEIDFEEEIIGRQSFASDLTPDVFRKELSRARTFGFMKDVERYWAAGFALGSSLENSVVICDDNNVINPEGLRYKDEFVRHKTLDAVGDLALAGAQILGCFKSYRGGHKLNALALQALLADKDAYEWTNVSANSHQTSRVDLVAVSAPAYAADKS